MENRVITEVAVFPTNIGCVSKRHMDFMRSAFRYPRGLRGRDDKRIAVNIASILNAYRQCPVLGVFDRFTTRRKDAGFMHAINVAFKRING